MTDQTAPHVAIPGIAASTRWTQDEHAPPIDLGTFDASYLPEECQGQIDGHYKERREEGWGYRCKIRAFYPTPQGLITLAQFLRQQQSLAQKRSISDRVEIFDRLADFYLSEELQDTHTPTIAGIAAVTGFSPAMVAHAIYLEQVSSKAQHLKRAIVQELGSPAALDRLTANPLLGGRTRVIGPELVSVICSANIPGLPHLDIMRSLLVKSACLAKVSKGEPIFLAAYARALRQLAPLLASTVAVVSMDRTDTAARAAFVGSTDHLIGYGGPSAINTLKAEVRAWQLGERKTNGLKAYNTRKLATTWHGHHLGVSIVTREAINRQTLAKLARDLAYDFSLFDQEACLSPAVLYVEEGGEVTPRDVALAVAEAMDFWSVKLPPKELRLEEAAARRRWLDWRILAGAEILAAPLQLPFVVALDKDSTFGPNAPGRIVRIVPVADLRETLEKLQEFGPYLQCASIAGTGQRLDELSDELARLGVTRLTRPGLMGTPSMMWRHDGQPCLSKMVRFCDEERLAPEGNY